MENFNTKFNNYIHFCKTQKCLDLKTIRAYTIDLSQFSITLITLILKISNLQI